MEPPRTKRALIRRSRMMSRRNRANDSAVPPAPAWNEKPSRTMPASSQKRAVSSAISRRSGDFVICVVPETILAGSPILSMTTTWSTWLPWICHGTQGNGTRLSVTTMTWSAYSLSASAKPSRPQADGPRSPVALPNGSAVGAAMTAMSMCTSPSWIAW